MKLKVNKQDLLPVLQKAIKFVARNSTMPILDCFKLSASDGELLIGATNLEMSISIPANADIEVDGEILVNAKLFLSVISSMGSEIDIVYKNNKIKVSDDKGTSNLSTLEADEFPEIMLSSDKLFAIDGQDFARITRQASVAASAEESRPVLTGLHYVISGNSIIATGTDGFAMAEASSDVLGANGDIDVIVPAKHAVTIASIFDGETVDVFGNNSMLVFNTRHIVVSTQLIEGKYPDISQIKPKESGMQNVVISKDALLSAISRVGILGNEVNLVVVSIADNEFTIQSENSEVGKSEVVVKCETDAKIGIALNYVFLKRLVEQVGDEVVINLSDKTSPIVIKDNDSDAFYSVLMPMHLKG